MGFVGAGQGDGAAGIGLTGGASGITSTRRGFVPMSPMSSILRTCSGGFKRTATGVFAASERFLCGFWTIVLAATDSRQTRRAIGSLTLIR